MTDNATQPERRRAARPWLAVVVVFLVVAGWTAATVDGPGLTWDETYYLSFANNYRLWLNALVHPPKEGRAALFDRKWIRPVWGLDPIQPGKPALGQKHPPLGKLAACAGMMLWGDKEGAIIAARIASAVLFGLLCAALFAFTRKLYGTRAAVFGVVALVAMPRLAAHMRLATLEPALLLTTTLTVFTFAFAPRSWAWSVVCGVCFGLALLSKINAELIPFVVAPWGLFFFRWRAVRALAVMGVVGVFVFIAGWPAFWPDPVGGLGLYCRDKLVRSPISVFYFGTRYKEVFAPWHYALVMPLITTPLLILAAAAAAVWRGALAWRSRKARLDALMLLGVAVPVAVVLSPTTGKYDGIRLMLSACPFLAVLAGRGAAWVWEALGERWGKRSRARVAVLGVAALWLATPFLLFFPFDLCYYNELIGGPWGARALGMETTYWFDTINGPTLRYLNRYTPPGARVACGPDERRLLWWYHRNGDLREDLRPVGVDDDWDYFILVPRRSWLEDPGSEEIARLKARLAKCRLVRRAWLSPLRGIPVCEVFERVRRHDAGR